MPFSFKLMTLIACPVCWRGGAGLVSEACVAAYSALCLPGGEVPDDAATLPLACFGSCTNRFRSIANAACAKPRHGPRPAPSWPAWSCWRRAAAAAAAAARNADGTGCASRAQEEQPPHGRRGGLLLLAIPSACSCFLFSLRRLAAPFSLLCLLPSFVLSSSFFFSGTGL